MNAGESSKKSQQFVARGKAACLEIWMAFKTLSVDAKVVVCVALGIFIVGIFCTSTTSVGAGCESENDADVGSLIADAKKSIKESYQKGLNEAKNDAEIQKNLNDVKEGCKQLGEAAGELKSAIKGLGF